MTATLCVAVHIIDLVNCKSLLKDHYDEMMGSDLYT